MAWGTVTVAGIALRETVGAEQTMGGLKIGGQESHPPSTRAHVEHAHHNVNALEAGDLVPVVFTDKTMLTGFYWIRAASSVLRKVHNGDFITAAWSMELERFGGSRDVEVESRVPTTARTTTVGTPPATVFWHAPAGGSGSYFTGSTVPAASVVRESADGPVTVYLGIPAGPAPRWTVAADEYLEGAARVLFDGIRRVGRYTPPLAVWEVHNGLVRLTLGASGSFLVSCWDDDDWRSAKSWQLSVNGAPVTAQPEMSVLRNTPEIVVVRLTYPTTPGRMTVDLSLRRGARFVTGIIKRHSSATVALARTAAEAATAVTGGLRATSADADGNRFVVGSAATVTTTTATASIARAGVTSLDFFVGHEVGASPQAGDAFADLWGQYRHSGAERTRMVLR